MVYKLVKWCLILVVGLLCKWIYDSIVTYFKEGYEWRGFNEGGHSNYILRQQENLTYYIKLGCQTILELDYILRGRYKKQTSPNLCISISNSDLIPE